jgi:hypothetical protein
MVAVGLITIPDVDFTVPIAPESETHTCTLSLQMAGRAPATGSTHCEIYRPLPAGNLEKPPLMVAPAGLRFISGLLEKANVSACANGAVINPKRRAEIEMVIAERRVIIFIALFIFY